MARSARCKIMRGYRSVYAVIFGLMCVGVPPAGAEVLLNGSPAAVQITTHDDTIADVLSAIAQTFNVAYRTAIPLDSPANETYSGSFREVISHLLEGYNYIVRTDQGATEVVVLGRRGAVAIAPLTSKSSAARGIVSQWR
jgi:hypothetical protein